MYSENLPGQLFHQKAANDILAENKVVAIGFFKDLESKEAKAFTAAAGALEEVMCAITSNDAVRLIKKAIDVFCQVFTLMGVKDDAAVVVMKKFDDLR